ncbi:MAG: 2'-5' RNA ligase family protein [Bacteroidetes bacterium]|nr:2'-5' RNA ligase family protein [Bacteroidota bacterium]
MNKRYFIGICLPSPLFEKAEELKKDIFTQLGLKGALRSPAHITLHLPFEFNEHKEKKLIDELNHFTFKTSFTIALTGFNFFDKRVAFIQVEENAELYNLKQQLCDFVAKNLFVLNEKNVYRNFKPHVTIAHRDFKTRHFEPLKNLLKTKNFKDSFTCNNFALFKFEDSWKVVKIFEF